MKLKSQLLVISLLMLLVPWAGCQFVREVEGVLRYGQAQSLLAKLQAVALTLSDKPELIYISPEQYQSSQEVDRQLYISRADSPIIVDGYDDGWPEIIARKFVNPNEPQSHQISFRGLRYGNFYYLFFSVLDAQVIYHNPSVSALGSGDRLVLRLGGHQTQIRDYVLSSSAPGRLVDRYVEKNRNGSDKIHWQYEIDGVWQDTAEGYDLEIKLPASLVDERFGFYFVDQDEGPSAALKNTLGNVSAGSIVKPPWLIYVSSELEKVLGAFRQQDTQFKVVDQHGWLRAELADKETLDRGRSLPVSVESSSESHWLVKTLLRWILLEDQLSLVPSQDHAGRFQRVEITEALGGNEFSQWYRYLYSNFKMLLSVAVPIYSDGQVIAVLQAEQSSDNFLSLADNAFARLLYMSFLIISIIGLGLLSYASFLSWRIRRLSDASKNVLDKDGSFKNEFPYSRAKDELGELSRNFAHLLGKLNENANYLRGLARKLSHELRTPLAIIRSSLDNLEKESVSSSASVFVSRAKEGTERLSYILTAMSEANRVEESILQAEGSHFNFSRLLLELTAVYQDLYTQHEIRLEGVGDAQYPFFGVPELIVQMLDKLMDNAIDFCPQGGVVKIKWASSSSGYQLSVINQGPLLPDNMVGQLFDSMVSIRSKNTSEQATHLGLGLYIVRLIAEFHDGKVAANNLADGSGVAIVIDFDIQ